MLKFIGRCVAAVMLWGVSVAHAQTSFPAKAVRIIVPFPPGGPTDLYARLIAQRMQESWGQPVLVENRAGGTGQVGTMAVREAPADGHTLLFTSNSAHIISPLLREPRPFDSVRDFTPVSMVLKYPMYIVLNPKVPAQSVAEFIALAKSQPGKLNYSSVGTGSGGHLACELFNIAAGTNIVHVPYKGAAPAQTAVIAGETQMMCDSVGFSHPQVKAGKLRGLALFSAKRSSAAPEVPTLPESGVPQGEAYIWLGLLGPAGMPSATLQRLSAETVRIMNLPDIRERVLNGGSDLVANTPEQFAADMAGDGATWLRVIREKNIKAE
jgi:tripartite-type tricarboxylate transporter receptor subunit TctC